MTEYITTQFVPDVFVPLIKECTQARDLYESPLVKRYASREMSYIFSPAFKFSTWRRVWLALAESQYELGLPQVCVLSQRNVVAFIL